MELVTANPRKTARVLLQQFARKRAPLLQEPSWAVMRAVALAVTMAIAARSRDEERKLMALSTLSRHLVDTPSKKAASRREWAAASALFADLMRLCADARIPPGERTQRLALLLGGAQVKQDFDVYLKWWTLAGIFDRVLEGSSEAVRLRAARWILSKSRPLAQRVGYGARETQQNTDPSGAAPGRSKGAVPVSNPAAAPPQRQRGERMPRSAQAPP